MSKDAQYNRCSFRGKPNAAWDIYQDGSIIGEVTSMPSKGYIAKFLNQDSYSSYSKTNIDDFLAEVANFLRQPNFTG